MSRVMAFSQNSLFWKWRLVFICHTFILLIMCSWTGQSSLVRGKKNFKMYLKINRSLKTSWRLVFELLSPGYGLLSRYKLVTFIFFISQLFSAGCIFKFYICNVFICIHFSILASVEASLCCKPKFRQIHFTIRHYSNEKGTGTEMCPAIVSGIVTGNTPVCSSGLACRACRSWSQLHWVWRARHAGHEIGLKWRKIHALNQDKSPKKSSKF